MNTLRVGLGWLLLGMGILVVAFAALAMVRVHFGSDSGALPDARGMVLGVSAAAFFFVCIPCTVIGRWLIASVRSGRDR